MSGAEVRVDGKLKGLTDANKTFEGKFEAGDHQIALNKQGYGNVSGRVEIAKGQTSTTKFEMMELDSALATREADQARAYIVVEALPGTDISIDQQPRGKVPPDGRMVERVNPGRHSIEARFDGYEPWSRTATAESHKQVSVFAEQRTARAPSIDDFEIGQEIIRPGQSTKLLWHSQNATSVSIDQGIGAVEGSGSQSVSPSQTTAYTLTARGPGGITKQTVTVTVAAAASAAPGNISSDTRCVQRFKDAYESMDIEALQKVWPSLDNAHRFAIRESFRAVQAIKIEENQCVETLSGNTAQYTCSETMTYIINGKRQQPTPPTTIEFTCKKTSTGAWVIENRVLKVVKDPVAK